MSPAGSAARPPGLALVIVIDAAIGLVALFALTIDKFHSLTGPGVALGYVIWLISQNSGGHHPRPRVDSARHCALLADHRGGRPTPARRARPILSCDSQAPPPDLPARSAPTSEIQENRSAGRSSAAVPGMNPFASPEFPTLGFAVPAKPQSRPGSPRMVPGAVVFGSVTDQHTESVDRRGTQFGRCGGGPSASDRTPTISCLLNFGNRRRA